MRPAARNHGGALSYCTLAVTLAFPLSVSVQLELDPVQAPDQVALRPPETVSVIAVPEAKDACLELPTGTLIPAGLEVTVWPLRPVADTVRVKFGGGGGALGLRNRVPISVRPPAVAKTVNPVCVVTTLVG